jgi:hypothetical protein
VGGDFAITTWTGSGAFPGAPTMILIIAMIIIEIVREQMKPRTTFFCHGIRARHTMLAETRTTVDDLVSRPKNPHRRSLHTQHTRGNVK